MPCTYISTHALYVSLSVSLSLRLPFTIERHNKSYEFVIVSLRANELFDSLRIVGNPIPVWIRFHDIHRNANNIHIICLLNGVERDVFQISAIFITTIQCVAQ